ncbi:hypothetical protein CONLIGDRAFT_319606 [Coniochaeta ligniaria NRRL 30616]|uniref:Ubiquitin-like protease family profile domain-containing protein n=1 Tax=Coniochaeta ligniaria NRRL 30616 TaxID=1408157 RepID=A0A1J7I3W0_9PEZI|nr:hypothetical protein CONLIGDRAFT_319606 [Coniochaeta ligniaria NRRL 30616]
MERYCEAANIIADDFTLVTHPLWLELSIKLPEKLPTKEEQTTILSPLHHQIPGGHWTLLVLDTKHGSLAHYDPARLGGLVDKVFTKVQPWISNLLPTVPKWCTSVLSGPKQDDVVSCGLFVLGAIAHILTTHSPQLEDMPSSPATIRELLAEYLGHAVTLFESKPRCTISPIKLPSLRQA